MQLLVIVQVREAVAEACGMKPTQITSLKQLVQAADDKKAVYCPSHPAYRNRIPAAFVQNLQGRTIQQLLDAGLYLYRRND